MMARVAQNKATAVLILVVVLVAGAWIYQNLAPNNEPTTDIYYNYVDSSRILHGENPYARIQNSDMRRNDKYATYFPLFYLLSYVSQRAGLIDYLPWITFWRSVFLLFTLACGAVIFWTFYSRRQVAWAAFAALFWFFSRWDLYVAQQGLLDPLPIFCLLLSLLLFDRRRWLSLLLFSISLAFKQIDIFLVPLYLILVWQTAPARRLRAVVLAAGVIASVPLLASLPFLAWDAPSFVRSLAFSVTRRASAHVDAAPLSVALGLDGIVARMPMLALMGLALVLAWRRRAGRYTISLLLMAAFVDLNPVLYLQYFAWLAPFIPLAAADALPVVRAQAPAGQAVLAGPATPQIKLPT